MEAREGGEGEGEGEGCAKLGQRGSVGLRSLYPQPVN